MTTADILNLQGKPIVDQTLLPADLFAIGAGHVNPSKANDPGLVYHTNTDDYIPYLCGLRYTDSQIGDYHTKEGSTAQTYRRTVTNVGQANSSYPVEIVPPEGVDVVVKPNELIFNSLKQEETYSVTFKQGSGVGSPSKPYSHGYLRWVSGKYSVKSSIAVTFPQRVESSPDQKTCSWYQSFMPTTTLQALITNLK
ncbi:Subtilisin-like protease [Quillaja saponaria]|uniref:Subtilisin-like protease n=1 Tax=Quillaja saponaria TaxID=32244 RepID=A0AAD7PEB8_QUISA|nr:Subtilisin-like protease [Quillaja saponaria]